MCHRESANHGIHDRSQCPNKAHMGEFACANPAQCWEPCGELGKSEEHMVAVPRNEVEGTHTAPGASNR